MSSFERTDQDQPSTTERERIAGLVGLAIGEAEEKGRVNLGQYADAILARIASDPQQQRVREIALDQAARVATGRESQQQLVQRAQAFEAFLRGDALAAVTSAHVEGGDLDVLEILLGFIRERTFEDASGLRSLEGADVQAEAESILVDLTHEQLRMMAHVVGVAATLVRSAERRRS